MRRILAAVAAVAVIASSSLANLANQGWAGTTKSVSHGYYALIGEVATGRGKLVVKPVEDGIVLTTTTTGFAITGTAYGTLNGTFATVVPGKQYFGTIATSDANAWVANFLGDNYAAVTNVSATGFAQFKVSGDGTKCTAAYFFAYSANLSGTYLAYGEVKVTGKLVKP